MASKTVAALTAAAFLIAGQASAADAALLLGVKGEVMVSRGGKLLEAQAGALRSGDRVVTRAGGEARLRYADGCEVTVRAKAMATIAAKSPCAGGAGLVTAGAASAQQTTPPAAQNGLSMLQWAGVGLTVVVLAVGLVAAADDLSISN